MRQRQYGLMTDLYELTMAAGYFHTDIRHTASFELFVRELPPCRSFLLTAGLQQILHYLTELRFEEDEIAYLRRHQVFRHASDAFFDYLKEFRFTGDLWAIPEGTPFFSNEPLLLVTAPLIEAQILETFLLSTINFQSAIATKAARIVEAAAGRPVIEFGARRAHGMESALYVARAAYIGGCAGTSNVEAGYVFGIPIIGTQAHSWTMAFDTEVDSFRAYVELFPETATLLVDTYDTLAATEAVTQLRAPVRGVRLDSGDIVELSKGVRSILDQAGMKETRIVVSSNLDEHRIAELLAAGAPIDMFGVGTQLSVSYDAPTLGGVYKLVEQVKQGQVHYRMKLSAEKVTYPARKQVWRMSDDSGSYEYDVIGLIDERPPEGGTPLLRQYMKGGRIRDPYPALHDIREQARQNVEHLPFHYRALQGARSYEVRITSALEALQQKLVSELSQSQPRG